MSTNIVDTSICSVLERNDYYDVVAVISIFQAHVDVAA